MNKPESSSDQFGAPRHQTFEGEPGLLSMNVTIHSPFVMEDWRAGLYRDAVGENLTGTLSREEARDLSLGCSWAANRATRLDLSQEETELKPQESQVLRLIGTERFMQIQTQAPPAELIDYMLSGGTGRFVRPRLDSITAAVAKGHIAWEDRFAEAGVLTPDELIARDEARIAAYKARLDQLPSERRPFREGIGRILKRLVG